MIALIIPYYKNRVMLGVQLEHLATLSARVRENLEIILVDDGSPADFHAGGAIRDFLVGRVWDDTLVRVGKAAGAETWDSTLFGMPFSLYRLDVDVRWNWIAARNIGAYHADAPWLLMTDIDHLVPNETLEALLDMMTDKKMPLPESGAFMFSRVDYWEMNGTTGYSRVHPHPNTWLMTGSTFNRVGGYDERFSGWYGTDGEFKRRVEGHCGPVVVLGQCVIRVKREFVEDADTVDYDRKTADDAANVARVKAEIARKPQAIKSRSFPYHRVF